MRISQREWIASWADPRWLIRRLKSLSKVKLTDLAREGSEIPYHVRERGARRRMGGGHMRNLTDDNNKRYTIIRRGNCGIRLCNWSNCIAYIHTEQKYLSQSCANPVTAFRLPSPISILVSGQMLTRFIIVDQTKNLLNIARLNVSQITC